MKKTLSVLCLAALASASASAQSKKTTSKKSAPDPSAAVTTAPAPPADGFTKSPNGLEYKIIKDLPGTTARFGDFISVHLISKVGDSVLFSTRQMMNGNTADFQLQMPPTRGDVTEGFTFMSAGDSAIFRMSIDSIAKMSGQVLPWMKLGQGQMIMYHVQMVSIKTAEEKQKEAAAAAAAQKATDDKLLQEYFTKNNIKATKTESGLYYTIKKQGKGVAPQKGDTVVANYTGKTMNGETFDSNQDPKFNHVEPFPFPVGAQRVIAGWDEGFLLFKKGSTGTLYIPSTLAYGANSPSPAIPANSILIFDVELVDVKPAKK